MTPGPAGMPGMLDRPRFWWRAVGRGTTSLNTWVGWFGLVVLVLGVAVGITVPLVFHVSHWVTAVIIMGTVVVVVAEGSYLEWKDAAELRRKTESALEGVQAELAAARRPAVSPPPAVSPDDFKPHHSESGEFPDPAAAEHARAPQGLLPAARRPGSHSGPQGRAGDQGPPAPNRG